MPDLGDRIGAAVAALRGDIVATLTRAIQIKSVNPNYPGEDPSQWLGREGQVSRLLASVYESAGCEVDIFGLVEGRENCVAVMPGSGGGRSLIFNGHVDVVPAGPDEAWGSHLPWS